MYQSQFFEMFGCKTPNVKVGDVSSVVSGKSISKDLEDIPGDIAYVKVADFNLPENNKYIQVSSRYVTSENANSSKLIPPGTIIFAKNGAASMSNKKRLTAIECCIDMNTLAIIPNSQKVDSGFLYAIFDSLDLSFYVRQGAVPSISPHAIEGIEIYLPSFDEQLSFSKICKQADKSKFSGLKSQFIEMFGNPMVEEQKYPLKKLGDCCVINPKRSKIALSDTDTVSFVPMPSVSEEGYLQDVSDAEYGSVKNGFTYFENGDVLFAKITPCMENGKGAIAHDLTNGIGMGSTEFHVLRPLKGRSNSYWLLTLTRLPEFRDRAAHNMSGTGGQQRVRADFLENFMIGLPPIEKQIELETICRVADKSKQIAFSRAS